MPYKDAERQRAAKAEHARRRRAAGVEPSRGTLRPLLTQDLRVRTAADVLGVIEGQQVAVVLADGELGTAERARVIATLAGVSLRGPRSASGSVLRSVKSGASSRRCAQLGGGRTSRPPISLPSRGCRSSTWSSTSRGGRRTRSATRLVHRTLRHYPRVLSRDPRHRRAVGAPPEGDRLEVQRLRRRPPQAPGGDLLSVGPRLVLAQVTACARRHPRPGRRSRPQSHRPGAPD